MPKFRSSFYYPRQRGDVEFIKFIQFVIFKPLYCFEETIGFDVKASFTSRPESRLIRRYNEPGDITK